MFDFLKIFLKGLLYLITLPFTLLALAIGAVVATFIFVIESIKICIYFFMGRDLKDPCKEELEAEELMKDRVYSKEAGNYIPKDQAAQQRTTQPNVQYQNITINNPQISNDLFNNKPENNEEFKPIEIDFDDQNNNEVPQIEGGDANEQ